MADYTQELKRHLAYYKQQRLGVRSNGVYVHRGVPKLYSHILPKPLSRMNIIETMRRQFWTWQEEDENGRRVSLHRFFHHLNSSQAMCFNLFFPLAWQSECHDALLKTLSLDLPKIHAWAFEKVLDDTEGTNFDFYLTASSASGPEALFEVKLSESDFGPAKPNKRRRKKLHEIYSKRLADVVDSQYLQEKNFFLEYQVLRNLSYLGTGRDRKVFFVLPKANSKINSHLQAVLKAVSDDYSSAIRVVYIEDLVEKILKALPPQNVETIAHFRLFREKYIFTSHSSEDSQSGR